MEISRIPILIQRYTLNSEVLSPTVYPRMVCYYAWSRVRVDLARSRLFCGPCVLCVVNSTTVLTSGVAKSRCFEIVLKGREGGSKEAKKRPLLPHSVWHPSAVLWCWCWCHAAPSLMAPSSHCAGGAQPVPATTTSCSPRSPSSFPPFLRVQWRALQVVWLSRKLPSSAVRFFRTGISSWSHLHSPTLM